MIIEIGKRRKKPSTTNNKLELNKVIVPKIESYLSYTNEFGDECKYTGPYTKLNNSYIFNKKSEYNYVISDEIYNTYAPVNAHFTYIDKNGFERTFNKLESLKYCEETNTYTGDIEVIDYIDTKVDIFAE